MNDDRLTRLPKWAQEEIARLRGALADAHEIIAAGPEDSDTFAGPYDPVPRPLGRGTSVEFRVGRRLSYYVRLAEGGALQVQSDQAIRLAPRATNFFTVEIEAPRAEPAVEARTAVT